MQGTFDAVCGGILLYIGFILLLKDFPEDTKRFCEKRPDDLLRRAGLFSALWVGAGVMAFIGRYL
jgi:zinc transporter 1/2/3